MKLKTDIAEEDKIRLLEFEIDDLRRKLNIVNINSSNGINSTGSKKFNELFGVVDGDFNLLSVNDRWDPTQDTNQNKLIGQKCYSAFCNSDKPCEGCLISEENKNKLVWYFLQPELEGKQRPCKRNIITPINRIEPFELTLKETDLFYEQLFESTGDSLLILNDKGRILKFTRQLHEMLSYTEKEFSKLTIYEIDDPSESLIFEERILQIKENKGAIFETDLIDRSGKRISVECSSSPIKYLDKFVFFVAIRNIEERKIAQKELHESEIRFRSLVENAKDLVMRFDRDHRHVFVNSSSLNLLGISPDKFIGKTHHEMAFPDDLCMLWEKEMDKVFASGIPDVINFSLEVEERTVFFDWQLIPEFDTEGECSYLLAVARDVTKRTLSEKALKEALITKDKFFSIIAHDLRNPFGSLKTLSECLQMDDSLTNEEVKEFAEIIHTSASQGYDLLENLLEWSRSQRGVIEWQPSEFDLIEIIDSNIRLAQANLRKKEIHLDFKAYSSSYVFADKYMIDTVFRNILANAIKFTFPKGNISIEITEEPSYYSISVKDDGKGISEENQKDLFSIDNKYSSKGTAMETGTGLGLILCKEFIDTNSGEIWIESEADKGSCFTFTIPKK